MSALALLSFNLMAMAIYIPYLLDKERKYDNETDTTSKPIRTGHIHQATTCQVAHVPETLKKIKIPTKDQTRRHHKGNTSRID